MKIKLHHYSLNAYVIIMEVADLPWKIMDFKLQDIFQDYKEWFKEYYDIDINNPTFPVKGHCIKFIIKRNSITDEILIAFKLRFA